ncbi:MAG: hypothetical protein SOI40_03435 [Lactococcus lactis]
MLITIHDNQMNKVGFLSNEVPEIPSFFNDTWHRYLAEGAATFSFSVNKFKNGSLQDYCQYLNDQAYISFRFDGQDHLFSVLTTEETDDVTTLNCATLNLELRNEQVGPLVNSATHNIQWYFEQINLFETTQIKIGINEVSNLTRTISYDGQESKLSRLLSIIGNFNAEFEFITNLNDDGTFERITLNIYQANDGVGIQGVGTWRNDVILYFGKNVTGVRRNVDRTQIFNASKVTGREGLNWTNSEWSVKNSEGVEEFYKRKGATLAYAPLSAELYPAQIQSDGDRWIRKDFETEYKNVNDMWGYILSQFKKYAYALVTYEVSASSSLINQSLGNGKPLSIGDTVRIQDSNFNSQSGGLILQARVSELEISFSNPSNNKLTFSNYIELENGISDDLESRLAQLIKDSTPYRAELTTTNGVQFKNGTGSTTLSAHIYKGSATTETIADSYEWSKDGTVVANVQEITVDASGVANKDVYSFKATVGGKVVANQSVTITNVDDGTNGRSVTNVSQKWRLTTTTTTPTQAWSDAGWLTTQPTTTATNKYLWSITRTTFNLAPLTQDVIEQKAVYGDKGDKGDTGNDGRAGKDGVGLRSTTVTYTISSSGTVTPTTGWTSQVPTLVKEQHLWTKTLWTYTDNTSETGYSVSYIAKDGNNGTNGIAGKDGVGISNTIIEYVGAVSGTSKPTGGWSTTIPTVPAGQYLWTRTTWQYTDGTSEQGYINALMGLTGASGRDGIAGKDGKGIKATAITYQASTNGTTAPTGTWSTSVPSVAKGSFLWTRTIWTYTDNTTEIGYAVAYMGTNGNNGTNGIAGKDGTGIKTTTITYAGSTSGTTAPTSGWTSTVPTVAAGSYLWTKTVWAYTDNTSETGYSVAMMGVKGDKGDQGIQGIQGVDGRQGIPGPKGADGKTQYTHIAYANSADGSKDFSTSDSNRTYIGMYVDFNINDSTTPSDYSWTLVKGADGTQGTPGKPGTDGKTPYFHTAWSYSADGTDGFTTVYPNLNLGDNTKTFVGAEYELSNIRGSIRIDPATQKTQDGDFYHLTVKAPRDNYDWFRFYLRPNSTMPNMTKVAIKPNTKYTFSVLLKGTGQHTIYAYQNWTAPNTPWTLQINLTSEWKIYTFTVTSSNVIPDRDVQFFIRSNNGTEINLKYPKVEEGSTATPYMQSASEVTTADYPSYIGQYTDFAQADSTNPSAYTWSLIRGNDGERGPQGLKGDPGATGIPGQPGADGKTSYLHIAYATNSTGTAGFDVSNATGKTYIGQYTDFTSADSTDPSKYTWSLIKGDKGDKGERGIQGPAGSNGDPGKIVSDTEPTTRFKGLTWKYLGMSDLTASDGTVILSGTEYYWSGTNWILNEINAHNINGDNLSVTNGTFTDGKIKSTWNSGTASGSTEIENSHINMSATNSSSKVTNSLGLDIQQGFGMRWTDPASNQSRSVSLDYGNLAFDRNGVAAGLNFDGANLSSSMPIQAPNTIVKSTQFSVSGIGIRLDRMMSFVAVTFSGQASSTINNSPTIINVLPDGFRPISPYSIDYMVPGNTANNGYIYFNPDGSIRIMATINSGYYIRGTRFYITNDVYPS